MATTVSRDEVSFPWAFPPSDPPEARCGNPYFRLPSLPGYRHTFGASEVMSVEIQYNAPGCKNMLVGFDGRVRAGSPWYDHWCNDVIHVQLKNPEYDCGAWLPADIGRVSPLPADTGTIRFEVGPGHDDGRPALEPEIPVEGFQLCTMVIRLDDGVTNGSNTRQQIELGCDPNSKAD